MTTEIVNQQAPLDVSEKGIFSNVEKFQQVKGMAEYLAQSNLVPKDYQQKPANVLIALSMAERIKADPMMVMQNLYVIHGRPSWSSQFLIASVNSCGRFSALQYDFSGKAGTDSWGCTAYAIEHETGETVRGPLITMAMAKAEKWSTKPGSKWVTMPELMLTYRAAAFFARTKAPEVSMGMYTDDEARDMGAAVVVESEPSKRTNEIETMLDGLQKAPEVEEKKPEPNGKPEAKKEAPPIDIVTFMKQSIDSCTTVNELTEVGLDIKEKIDDKLLIDSQIPEIKLHLNKALKKAKES